MKSGRGDPRGESFQSHALPPAHVGHEAARDSALDLEVGAAHGKLPGARALSRGDEDYDPLRAASEGLEAPLARHAPAERAGGVDRGDRAPLASVQDAEDTRVHRAVRR